MTPVKEIAPIDSLEAGKMLAKRLAMEREKNIKPGDIEVIMVTEETEWEAKRLELVPSIIKNKVTLEIQETLLKLAESKLKRNT